MSAGGAPAPPPLEAGKGQQRQGARHVPDAREFSWSRGQVEARLANIPPCLVGIEACVRAHHPNRRLKALGRDACPTSRSDRIKGGSFEPPLLQKRLLTKVPTTVFATEPSSGLTDEAVAGGIPTIVAAVVAVIVGVRIAER